MLRVDVGADEGCVERVAGAGVEGEMAVRRGPAGRPRVREVLRVDEVAADTDAVCGMTGEGAGPIDTELAVPWL